MDLRIREWETGVKQESVAGLRSGQDNRRETMDQGPTGKRPRVQEGGGLLGPAATLLFTHRPYWRCPLPSLSPCRSRWTRGSGPSWGSSSN